MKRRGRYLIRRKNNKVFTTGSRLFSIRDSLRPELKLSSEIKILPPLLLP